LAPNSAAIATDVTAHPGETELNIAPDEVPVQRKRAFIAAGLGWGLDGFDWTAITCVWLLPETRGKVIVEPEIGREPQAAGSPG
jgi:hypothetical protein